MRKRKGSRDRTEGETLHTYRLVYALRKVDVFRLWFVGIVVRNVNEGADFV